jgi:hypothetical protein
MPPFFIENAWVLTEKLSGLRQNLRCYFTDLLNFFTKHQTILYKALIFRIKAYRGEPKSFWGQAWKLGTLTKKALGVSPETLHFNGKSFGG